MLKKILQEFFKFLKMHRKKILLLALSFILGFILFSTVFLYVDVRRIAKIIFTFSVWKFLLYLSVPFMTFCLQAFRWSTIIRAYGFKVEFWKVFRCLLPGFGFSFLTPMNEVGGAPFKAYLLAKKQDVPFKEGLITVCVDDFVGVFMETLLATVGILLFIINIGLIHKLSWVIGLGSFLFMTFLVMIFLRLIKGKPIFSPILSLLGAKHFKKIGKIQKQVAGFETSFITFFREKKGTVKKIFFITFLMNITGICEYALLLYLMGAFSNWVNVFFIRMVINAANLFPVPAGLGVSEWGSAGFFSTTHAGKETGLVFSLLFKARSLFFSFIGIGIFAYYWVRNLAISQKITEFVKEKING